MENLRSGLLPLGYFMFIFVMAVLDFPCCLRAFSSCLEKGLLSSCGVWASHGCGFSCFRAPVLGHAGFSSCSS